MHVHIAGTPLPQSYSLFLGIWGGEHPAGFDEDDTLRRLRGFRREGIDFFVDLTARDELPSYAQLLHPGARCVRVPMRAGELPAVERVREAIAVVDRALGSGHFVYVHGAEGVERTGIVLGCWLASWGRPLDDPLASLADLRARLPGERRASPASEAGRELVRRWPAHRAGTPRRAASGLRLVTADQASSEGGSR